MKTILVGSLSALAFLVPLVSLAQENQPPTGGYCPQISQNLKRGDRDATTVPPGQVTELQKFLSDHYDLNPDDYVTGYFGARTQANVMRFQQEQNIIPVSGFVGPLTRAAIARVCAGAATPPPANPPPTNPPPAAPTCTLTLSPSSITLGQSATLSWSSTNALGGVIIPIGTVTPNGSQSTSPLTTTTFTGTFWGTQGQPAHCSITLTVTQPTTGNASCSWNGQTIASGSSVTAYQAATVPAGGQCISETRTCQQGILSGSYQYASCTVATTQPPTCTPDPTSPQTQTLSCPAGQTGSIIQTRTSTCPGPTWGAWTTTSNTCVVASTGGTNVSVTTCQFVTSYQPLTYQPSPCPTSTGPGPNLPPLTPRGGQNGGPNGAGGGGQNGNSIDTTLNQYGPNCKQASIITWNDYAWDDYVLAHGGASYADNGICTRSTPGGAYSCNWLYAFIQIGCNSYF
jgi:putative peptidoglycan binding protein